MASSVLTAFGFARELHGDFGDEGERAFGADEETVQVVAASVAMYCCQLRTISPSGRTISRAGNVIGGDAVGESVRAAGVFGDVATDGAGFLTGRVGSEVESGGSTAR